MKKESKMAWTIRVERNPKNKTKYNVSLRFTKFPDEARGNTSFSGSATNLNVLSVSEFAMGDWGHQSGTVYLPGDSDEGGEMEKTSDVSWLKATAIDKAHNLNAALKRWYKEGIEAGAING